MKKIKTTVCLVLAVLLVSGMASCGGGDMSYPTSTPTSEPAASPVPDVTVAPEETPVTEAGENNLTYSEDVNVEFLRNRLSNYFDTPMTEYVKLGEEYDDGELHFIYQAKDKDTGEVLGTYRFPEDLHELEQQEPDGEYEEIWDADMFKD